MIFRHDQITVDFPTPSSPDANAAAAIQELLGGKFGEMSTLMNYTFQSFNFRGRKNFRPFYDLISNIAAHRPQRRRENRRQGRRSRQEAQKHEERPRSAQGSG